jgi:homopolymeric O-antigen transport system ATP-binding protein
MVVDQTIDRTQASPIAPARSDTEVAVSVSGLGKMYRIYDHPQDRLKQMLFARFGKTYGHEFWGLRDVSFEVQRGERFGIIGRNGSGKSTLLQIIAGTLAPSEGQVRINGRVAALLELGSGFNPEFSGRENVFLNGSILGLSPQQLESRFDEIAGFADIGEFIEQPVKLYSSGMFVRLAFAVTTSVDADVLLIDEALAVGDVFFRQKCYRRLEALRDKGVSILLVSHAMADIEQFCQRVLLLNRGSAVFQGAASEAVKRYYLIEQQDYALAPAQGPVHALPCQTDPSQASREYSWPAPTAFLDISGASQISNNWARCTGVAMCNSEGQPCRVFEQGETASFFFEFELLQDIEVPIGGVVIQSDKGVTVHGKSTLEHGSAVPCGVTGGTRLRFRQNVTLEIAVGEYTFLVGLAAISAYDYEHRHLYSHPDLHTKIVRLCHLPAAGHFALVFRRNGSPVQLLHHGVANLPGDCYVSAEPPGA